MPKRIQRKRSRGWKMPEDAVYVGRPTKWGNPFSIDAAIEAGYLKSPHDPLANLFIVDVFRDWLSKVGTWWQSSEADERRRVFLESIPELRGKDLACWCALDKPCHADVLLELANASPTPQNG